MGDDAPTAKRNSASSASKFAERAFRRPLTAEQKAIFIDRQFKDVPEPGDGRQASCALGSQVTSISLPRDRRAAGLTAMTSHRGSRSGSGIHSPIEALLECRRFRSVGHPRHRSPARPSAWSTTLAPAPSSEASFCNGSRSIKLPTSPRTPSAIPSSTRRSFPICGRRSTCFSKMSSAATQRISPALARRIRLLEWPAGAVLRSQSPCGRAIPEGLSRAGRARRVADPPLLDGEFRLHGDELADPSRRLHRPERPGPGASAAARGRRSAGRRSPSRPDDPPARDDFRPSPNRASRATA